MVVRVPLRGLYEIDRLEIQDINLQGLAVLILRKVEEILIWVEVAGDSLKYFVVKEMCDYLI